MKKNSNIFPDFWMGFFVSAILVIAIFVGITTNINEFVGNLWPIILGGIIASLLIFSLVIFFRDFTFKRITGTKKVEFEEIQSESEHLLEAYLNQNKEAQLNHSIRILQNFGNWYLWVRFYRWVIATSATLLLAIAGFVGSVLLSQQNQIMQYETDISELNLMGEVRDSLKGTGILEYQLRDSIIPARYFNSDEFGKIDYRECNIEASIMMCP